MCNLKLLFKIPGLLNEPLSLFLQLLPLEAHNHTQQLVLQPLQGHCVVHHHGSTEVGRSVLGVGQLGVQVQPEVRVIVHFLVSQDNELPSWFPLGWRLKSKDMNFGAREDSQ